MKKVIIMVPITLVLSMTTCNNSHDNIYYKD